MLTRSTRILIFVALITSLAFGATACQRRLSAHLDLSDYMMRIHLRTTWRRIRMLDGGTSPVYESIG